MSERLDSARGGREHGRGEGERRTRTEQAGSAPSEPLPILTEGHGSDVVQRRVLAHGLSL